MILRAATGDDLAFIMATERLPGYERTVGQWDEAQHRAEMALATSRYVIAEEGGAPVAFAMLQNLEDPGGSIYLKRIAVARQGEGVGTRALRLLQDDVFALPKAHRFWLHYAETNERGHRLYTSAGFVREGLEREIYQLADGTRVSAVICSILRREWEKLRA